MSDVGLGATLDLNIADALRRIDQLGAALNAAAVARVTVDTTQVAPQITAAVEAADTAVTVTGDAAELTGSIDAAVDNADTGVVVTGEAGELTGDIDAAIENANTDVTVTGDAAQLTGAIDAAVQNADTNVTVSGSVPPSLAQGAEALGDSLDAAATSGVSLGTILSGLSVGAAIAGLRALGDAASDLQESTTKAQVVFGAQFGQIEAFAQEAATATGLSEQAALEAAGTFGNLFQALGSSREEASKLSPEVVQLGADLASFNNIPVDEALEKIRSGLVGEIEPLRSLGVSFLAADVQAKGLELGLGDLNGQMTEGEKVQARYALIVEQTTFAQGDFARTSEGLANQQRILRAELGNAAAAAGQELLPAFLAIGDEVRNAIPGLGELAGNVLPAVSDALVALSPLIGTTVDLLVAFSPIVQAVANVIAALPSPVVEVAGALLLLNRSLVLVRGATALLGLSSIATGLANLAVPAGAVSSAFAGTAAASVGLRGGLSALTASLSSPTAALAAATGAVLLYNDTMAGARQEGADFGASLRESFDPSTASLTELRDASEQLGEKITFLKDEVDDSFLGRNTINRDFNAAIGEGVEQTQAFREEIDATADALEASQIQEGFEAQFGDVVGSIVGASDALGRLRDTAPAAVSAIQGLRLSSEGTDRQILTMALSLGEADLSSEQLADTAQTLGLDVEDLGSLIADTTGALDEFVSSAVSGLPTVQDVFAATLGSAQQAAQETATGIREAAQAQADAIREAAADRVEAAGEGLGEEEADAIREAADRNAEAIIDAAETNATAVEGSAQVTAEAFTNTLIFAAASMADFREDLALITSSGFADVAGLLAQTGQVQGDALADELAASLEAGNTTIVQNLSDANTIFQDETQATVTYMRDVLGPQLILQSGLIGDSSAAALFEGVNFSERIRIQGELAQTTLSEQGKVLAVIAALESADVARAYGANLGLDQATIDAAVQAGNAIREHAPRIGVELTAGVVAGIRFSSGDVNTEAERMVNRAEISARPAAGGAGIRIGTDLTGGVVAGIRFSTADIESEAARMINRAEISARDEAHASSPSLLFADLGADLGAGVALGLEAQTTQVVAAAEQIVRDAADAVARVAPDVTAEISAGPPGAEGGVPETVVRALEAIAAGGGGESLQIGPFHGGDVRNNLREASVELQAIRRRRR